MTRMAQTTTDAPVANAGIQRRLDELRRSFDDDIRYAPRMDVSAVTELLVFRLAGEAYAFPVTCALEILQVPVIVPVPNVPPSILGIINFRGQILSVTTIHGVLGLSQAEPGSGGRVIVTKELSLMTGILVDGVDGIAEIAVDAIQPIQATSADDRARFLSGQVYANGTLVSLLDMEQLCESDALRAAGTDSIN